VRLGAETAARGGTLIDAPVSVGAKLPKLLVMVGGDAGAFEQCRPALEAFGDPVLHLGALGSGQITKLVNNALLAAAIGVGDSALALGADLGLDPVALHAALASGSASGTWATFLDPRPRPGVTGRTSEWARKDVGLVLAQTVAHGLDTDRAVLELAQRGVAVIENR
jgi:3-hydroxyisobutyrate dehydrogenase-like beta-hydroxyacid dehydrogenase